MEDETIENEDRSKTQNLGQMENCQNTDASTVIPMNKIRMPTLLSVLTQTFEMHNQWSSIPHTPIATLDELRPNYVPTTCPTTSSLLFFS